MSGLASRVATALARCMAPSRKRCQHTDERASTGMSANECCAICLETDEGDGVGRWSRMSCGHRYHAACIQIWARESGACPICSAELPADLRRLSEFGSRGSPDSGRGAPCSSDLIVPLHLHVRRCTGCHGPIEKVGGCNQMRCRCGQQFDWREAAPVMAQEAATVTSRNSLRVAIPERPVPRPICYGSQVWVRDVFIICAFGITWWCGGTFALKCVATAVLVCGAVWLVWCALVAWVVNVVLQAIGEGLREGLRNAIG